MLVLFWIGIFVISIIVLVKAADFFTEHAEKLGKILRLPNFIVGVLIVAVGTSMPELATSVMGVAHGEAEFLSGNVLGTVIVNILLGLGIAVLLTKRKTIFNWDIVSNDLPFFAAAIFLVVISLIDGKFSFAEALLFLVGYIVYVVYAYYAQKEEKAGIKAHFKKQIDQEIHAEINKFQKQDKILSRIFGPKTSIVLYLLIGLVFVVLSSKYVVDAVINLAGLWGLGTTALAATVVALGTSLPEIMVATSAARRGNFDMVIGDILGSNIFDIFVIYGVTGLFTTLTITPALFATLTIFLVGSFFLLWLFLIDKKITKTEALLFVVIYVFFVGKLFNLF